MDNADISLPECSVNFSAIVFEILSVAGKELLIHRPREFLRRLQGTLFLLLLCIIAWVDAVYLAQHETLPEKEEALGSGDQ